MQQNLDYLTKNPTAMLATASDLKKNMPQESVRMAIAFVVAVPGQEVVQLMLRPAQDVAHKAGEHHAQDGAQRRDVHGHPQGVEDGS